MNSSGAVKLIISILEWLNVEQFRWILLSFCRSEASLGSTSSFDPTGVNAALCLYVGVLRTVVDAFIESIRIES